MKIETLALIVALIVALVFGGLFWLEKRKSNDLADDLAKAEQIVEAAKINREVINKADQKQREVDRAVSDAIQRSETVADAIAEIERMEGR